MNHPALDFLISNKIIEPVIIPKYNSYNYYFKCMKNKYLFVYSSEYKFYCIEFYFKYKNFALKQLNDDSNISIEILINANDYVNYSEIDRFRGFSELARNAFAIFDEKSVKLIIQNIDLFVDK